MNKHREIIYRKRNNILENENLHEEILRILKSQISKLTSSELNKNSDDSVKNIIKAVNTFLEVEAIDTKVEIDDVEAIINIELNEIEKSERLSEYISKISIEELEKIKDSAREESEFYDLEKRILLQSIDELWMLHIDSMTKLREEVAFE
jgi:preprotein translocase subunit SecA